MDFLRKGEGRKVNLERQPVAPKKIPEIPREDLEKRYQVAKTSGQHLMSVYSSIREALPKRVQEVSDHLLEQTKPIIEAEKPINEVTTEDLLTENVAVLRLGLRISRDLEDPFTRMKISNPQTYENIIKAFEETLSLYQEQPDISDVLNERLRESLKADPGIYIANMKWMVEYLKEQQESRRDGPQNLTYLGEARAPQGDEEASG